MITGRWPILAGAGLLTLVAAGGAGPLYAHPHVWVDAAVTFVFTEAGELESVRQRWVFDELFSSWVIEAHDADADRRFADDELRSLRAGAFDNLKDYGYFTHLRVNGQPVPLEQVVRFEAEVQGDRLAYTFTLDLPNPVAPARGQVALGVFDPEYYVELTLDQQDPVQFEGLPAGACSFEVYYDAENPIYFGMVEPPMIGLQCAHG